MKFFSILFLTLIFAKSCQGQTLDKVNSTKIEYNVISRGFYQNIIVENSTVSIINQRGEKPTQTRLSEEQVKQLFHELKKVNLEEIASLKAPTQKRFHDGAAMANLKISVKEKTYESQTFDHGFPPDKLKKIVNKIQSFTAQ
jgi:hypothetical protein